MAVHNMIESHKYQLAEAFITDCKPEHKMLNKTRWDAQLEFKTGYNMKNIYSWSC